MQGSEVGRERAATLAGREMSLDHGRPGRVQGALDVLTDLDVVFVTHHLTAPLNMDLSLNRALCTCDFDVPSEIPRSAATS